MGIVLGIELKLATNFASWERKIGRLGPSSSWACMIFLFQNVIGTKTAKETWNCLLKIYEAKGLTNMLFLRHQLFAYKMNSTNNMLDHINKIKSMGQQLGTIGVKLEANDLVMLLCNLQSLSTT